MLKIVCAYVYQVFWIMETSKPSNNVNSQPFEMMLTSKVKICSQSFNQDHKFMTVTEPEKITQSRYSSPEYSHKANKFIIFTLELRQDVFQNY